jgi:hypothetical protein
VKVALAELLGSGGPESIVGAGGGSASTVNALTETKLMASNWSLSFHAPSLVLPKATQGRVS